MAHFMAGLLHFLLPFFAQFRCRRAVELYSGYLYMDAGSYSQPLDYF
jgi:hypothetical protein